MSKKEEESKIDKRNGPAEDVKIEQGTENREDEQAPPAEEQAAVNDTVKAAKVDEPADDPEMEKA